MTFNPQLLWINGQEKNLCLLNPFNCHSQVSIPFIVLHGEEDKVTDKAVSIQLFKVASSSDKTMKLYEGMWHGLLYGEPEENTQIVFRDILNWLDERVATGNSRIEMELKHNNDDLISLKWIELLKQKEIVCVR